MKTFIIECIMAFIIIGLIIQATVQYSKRIENYDKQVRKNCEKLCTSLSLTIENYFECCLDCYKWEKQKRRR